MLSVAMARFYYLEFNLTFHYNMVTDRVPFPSCLVKHGSDMICVDDGSWVPSYNFIIPANMCGALVLSRE